MATMVATDARISGTVRTRVMSQGVTGSTTSTARVWQAELRPISPALTPWDLRIRESSGQVSPSVIATTETVAITRAILRRRWAGLRTNSVIAAG